MADYLGGIAELRADELLVEQSDGNRIGHVCKGSASRGENKTKNTVFCFYPEAKPILGKVPKIDIPSIAVNIWDILRRFVANGWSGAFFGMIFVIL